MPGTMPGQGLKQTPDILVIDDNPAEVGLVRESLAETFHQSRVHGLGDVDAAIAYLNRNKQFRATARPDLVILDFLQPNSLRFLSLLRSNPELRRIPVVVFSGSASNKDVTRSYELGANCYVSKPADLKRYFSAVRAIEEFWFSYASLPPKGE